MEHATLLIILACAFGFFMAWGIGANDVANAMGTSVGSRALTIKQAFIIAVIFEFLGATLAGGQVTQTIQKGIIDASLLADSPEILVYGMIAALLATGTWLLAATYLGWPVSTTHTIIGSLVGFGAVIIGVSAVQWSQVSVIAISWVLSPLLGGIFAYLLFISVQTLIFNTTDPFRNAKRYVPFYMFLVGFIITLVTTAKGLKHLGLPLTGFQSVLIAVGVGALVACIGSLFLRRIKIDPKANRRFHFASVERVFAVLMVFTACATAFAHGSNDVANAVGPLAAVVNIVGTGDVLGQAPVPFWALLLGATGIVIGLVTYGHKVITTVGKKITHLTPSRGFAATLGAATTVVLASGTGLPVSTTHVLVGAILGVGMARGIAALNMRVVNQIFLSWVVTLPAGAFLSVLFFYLLRSLFNH